MGSCGLDATWLLGTLRKEPSQNGEGKVLCPEIPGHVEGGLAGVVMSGLALQGGDTKVFPGLWEFWTQNFWPSLGLSENGGLAFDFGGNSVSWESFLVSAQVPWHGYSHSPLP